MIIIGKPIAEREKWGHACFGIILGALIFLAALPAFASAAQLEMNIDKCSACGSASEYASNDTGIAVTLGQGEKDEINFTAPAINGASQIDDARIRVRYDGDPSLDGQWTFVFRSRDGETTYCTFQKSQESGSDVYFDIDANSSCAWTAAKLADLNLTISNDDISVPGLGSIKYLSLFIDYTEPWLEVNLSRPEADITTNIRQNSTFVFNATVVCRGAACGSVNATVRFNLSSTEPDAAVSITQGDKPLFINESNPTSTKDCPALLEDEACSVEWIINATGDLGSEVKMDSNFMSPNLASNDTKDAIISIIPCSVDFTLQWSSISFGDLAPNTNQNEAQGNSNSSYNITISDGSCPTDLYISGTNLENSSLSTLIGAGNVTWSNTTNSFADSHELGLSARLMHALANPLETISSWYWINVPPVFAGRYNGTIIITGEKNV